MEARLTDDFQNSVNFNAFTINKIDQRNHHDCSPTMKLERRKDLFMRLILNKVCRMKLLVPTAIQPPPVTSRSGRCLAASSLRPGARRQRGLHSLFGPAFGFMGGSHV